MIEIRTISGDVFTFDPITRAPVDGLILPLTPFDPDHAFTSLHERVAAHLRRWIRRISPDADLNKLQLTTFRLEANWAGNDGATPMIVDKENWNKVATMMMQRQGRDMLWYFVEIKSPIPYYVF